MKKIVYRCLLLFCIVSLGLGLTACNEAEPSQAPGEDVETPASDELSDDIFSLMFSLDGVVYTLPVPFAELEANGWEGYDGYEGYDYDLAAQTIYPGQWTGAVISNEGQILIAGFINLGEEVLPVNESHVEAVSIPRYDGNDIQLIFPGNIMRGSTYEDVLEAHGEPSERLEGDESIDLAYEAEHVTIWIAIDKETNSVVYMSMRVMD